MEGRSIFISSCSRRELAKRRPSPSAGRLQLAIAVLLLTAAAAAFLVVHGV